MITNKNVKKKGDGCEKKGGRRKAGLSSVPLFSSGLQGAILN